MSNRWLSVALLIYLLATNLVGAAYSGSRDGPEDMAPMGEETEAALTDLDAAGISPAMTPLIPDDLNESTVPSNGLGGSLEWRVAVLPTGGPDILGRLYAAWQDSEIHLRIRERPGEHRATGTISLGGELGRIWLGGVGLAHGFGVLSAAPGRRSTLGANVRLSAGKSRIVRWTSVGDPVAVTGGAGELRLGSWTARLLTGTGPSGSATSGAEVHALQIQCADANGQWSLLCSQTGIERGASLSGGRRGGVVDGGFEIAGWQAGPGSAPQIAWVVHLGSRPSPGAFVELSIADGGGSRGPARGGRPVALSGWNGTGWALRMGMRANRRGGVRAVLASAGHRAHASLPRRLRSQRFAGEVWWQWRPDLKLSGFLGIKSVEGRSWSERFPWELPELDLRSYRWQPAVKLQLRRPTGVVTFLVRSLSIGDGGSPLRRTLVGINARWEPAEGWLARGNWTSAWGQTVDLVSAAVPVTGLLVSRHWGQWRSESVVGLERKGRRGSLRAAVSRRKSVRGIGQRPVISIWVSGSVKW